MSAPGETNLKKLYENMEPKLWEGVFVFAKTEKDTPQLPKVYRMKFDEGGEDGMTWILEKDHAEEIGLPYEFPSRMITLQVHSSLEAVGFLAPIATRLAGTGIAVNVVSAFHHDHLFVPEDRAQDTMAVLKAMIAET